MGHRAENRAKAWGLHKAVASHEITPWWAPLYPWTNRSTPPQPGGPEILGSTLCSMWDQPEFIPFCRETVTYTEVSYSSSSWGIPMLRYCKRGVVGEEYSSARMVFRSRRSIK